MKSIFEALNNFISGFFIIFSPTAIGLFIAAFVYFPNPSTTRLIIACGISFAGLCIGILWAKHLKDTNGHYGINASLGSPDLDDFQEKMKREEEESRKDERP